MFFSKCISSPSVAGDTAAADQLDTEILLRKKREQRRASFARAQLHAQKIMSFRVRTKLLEVGGLFPIREEDCPLEFPIREEEDCI